MKQTFTIFLQVVIVIFGLAVLVFMLWEPHLEGRNVNATFFQIYFNDPFLAYVYVSSIAFFVALYQTFKVLSYVRENKILSEGTIKALGIIKHCGMVLATLILGGLTYIFIAIRGKDDIAGGVAMGLILILISATFAITAGVFERRLHTNMDASIS